MESKEKIQEILNLEMVNELSRPENESGDVFFVSGAQQNEVEVEENDLVTFNIANSFESLTYNQVASKGLSDKQIDVVVDKILSAITDMSRGQEKGTSYIEPNEIEKVKDMLKTEKCNYIARKEIESELTKFQNEILSKYRKELREYACKKFDYENEIKFLENDKSEIVSKRVAQLQWPFNEETRDIDNKVYNLKCKVRSCEMKLASAKVLRPMAKEKDIVKFHMQLKEKFAQ